MRVHEAAETLDQLKVVLLTMREAAEALRDVPEFLAQAAVLEGRLGAIEQAFILLGQAQNELMEFLGKPGNSKTSEVSETLRAKLEAVEAAVGALQRADLTASAAPGALGAAGAAGGAAGAAS